MARFIMRKRPMRFSSINSWGGPKTVGRSGLAKRLKKMRKQKQEYKAKYGSNMLSTLGMQRQEVKATIKSARRKKVYLPEKS